MGMMKNQIFFPQKHVVADTYSDLLNYLRFTC